MSRQPALCNRGAWMPGSLVMRAVAMEPVPGAATTADVVRHPLCMLEPHTDRPHYGLLLILDGTDTGAVWARWDDGGEPELVVLPDCDAGGCCSFDGHPGEHTP